MSDKTNNLHHWEFLGCIILTVTTLTVYWQVQNYEFINFDDPIYITENPYIKKGFTIENITWAFTSNYASNWHPVTWLSHLLDFKIYGFNAKGHHLNNIIIHLVNINLLFLLLQRMTDAFWRSVFVAGLFALHPLHIESVVWISERKDVLSTCFGLMTLWAYLYYVEIPLKKTYFLCLILFAFSLMSKPMLVSLPFVLLLLDYWPLKRIQLENILSLNKSKFTHSAKTLFPNPPTFHLLVEKIPFFFLITLSSIITYHAQKTGGAFTNLVQLKDRLANAVVSYEGYIIKMIWPHRLAFFYPHPIDSLPLLKIIESIFFLSVISLLVLFFIRKRPYLIVGWLWYLGTLVPVIGLIQIGSQAMADRYTYFPLIGLFIMISWGIPPLLQKWRYSKIVLSLSFVLVFLSLSICTWKQAQYWKNSISLNTRALQVTKNNYFAYHFLGKALLSQKQYDKAISNFQKALIIKPDFIPALSQLGFVFEQNSGLDEAMFYYLKILQIQPNNADAHFSIANILSLKGNLNKARSHYLKALRINPNNAKIHNNLGTLLEREGNLKEARIHYLEALQINPKDAKAKGNLERILKKIQNKLNPTQIQTHE
jgi:Flp pilus assembly protein TadD